MLTDLSWHRQLILDSQVEWMFLFFVDQILSFWWYCWWKKSCTSWDVKFLVNNAINYLSISAGFLPPTVVSNKPSQATRRCWYSVNPPIQAAQILQEQGRKSKPISQLLGVKFWSPWGFGSGANGAETLIVFFWWYTKYVYINSEIYCHMTLLQSWGKIWGVSPTH